MINMPNKLINASYNMPLSAMRLRTLALIASSFIILQTLTQAKIRRKHHPPRQPLHSKALRAIWLFK